MVASFAASLFLLMWCGIKGNAAILSAALASVLAGLVESLPIRLDDNITVTVVAAVTLSLSLLILSGGSV